jgi:CRP-like cAMP-binding protein
VTRNDNIAGSFLGGVEQSTLDAVTRRAVVHHHRSGDIVVSEADRHWTGIVLSGMARVYLTTPAGRQVTLRHARAGSSIGIGALMVDSSVSAQAVTDCRVLRLDSDHVRELARQDSRLAMAIAHELSLRLFETYRELVIRDQGSVRQRLARQLLHFAGVVDPEEPLGLAMNHEQLADAVGSAREVVSRHLQRFQTEGMLGLQRGHITILDPDRLDLTARVGD